MIVKGVISEPLSHFFVESGVLFKSDSLLHDDFLELVSGNFVAFELDCSELKRDKILSLVAFVNFEVYIR